MDTLVLTHMRDGKEQGEVKKKGMEVGGGSRECREVTPRSGDGKVGGKSQECQVHSKEKITDVDFSLL